MPDDLVGGRGAIGDEIAVIRVENAGGIAFALGDRAGMVKQLAEFLDGIADVGTKHVFTEELVEHLADRRFQESDASGVAGTMPGVRSVLCIVHEGAEKRWCQSIQIGFGFTDNMACDEFRRILEHVNETVQLAQQIIRDVA